MPAVRGSQVRIPSAPPGGPLSGSLRVGFLACSQDIANELADIKTLTSITTSQFTERLIYLMLVDGHYRKYLSRLHERLGEARLNVVRASSASDWNCTLGHLRSVHSEYLGAIPLTPFYD